jgi:hypothetical protein
MTALGADAPNVAGLVYIAERDQPHTLWISARAEVARRA